MDTADTLPYDYDPDAYGAALKHAFLAGLPSSPAPTLYFSPPVPTSKSVQEDKPSPIPATQQSPIPPTQPSMQASPIPPTQQGMQASPIPPTQPRMQESPIPPTQPSPVSPEDSFARAEALFPDTPLKGVELERSNSSTPLAHLKSQEPEAVNLVTPEAKALGPANPGASTKDAKSPGEEVRHAAAASPPSAMTDRLLQFQAGNQGD